ncbi:MAG: DUF2231 domain-containing protein [Deltaproteobacteria bacterium]|nr:MAG: DUF2231 domain-containing protein [Deltaproteobacteria bacterium]
MAIRLHELHPTLIHAPLGLLPVAAGLDLVCALKHDRFLDHTARTLWSLGTLGGLAAGATGLAASQEVKITDQNVEQAMLIHGLGNVIVTLGAASMLGFRAKHRPTITSAFVALGAVAATLFTGWLGGELVYARGVGVKRMAAAQGEGVKDSPELVTRESPSRFLKDVANGFVWAMRGAKKVATGEERLTRRALSLGA